MTRACLTFAALCAAALAALPVAFAYGTPCPTEDSANCYWDAQTRSNGKGDSFLDLGGRIVWRGAAE
jgi:hypothetical protein